MAFVINLMMGAFALMLAAFGFLYWKDKKMGDLRKFRMLADGVTDIEGIVKRCTDFMRERSLDVWGFYFLDPKKEQLSCGSLGNVSLLEPSAPTMAFYELRPYRLNARLEIDRMLMSWAGPDTWFVPLSMSYAQPGSQGCQGNNCDSFGQDRCWLTDQASYKAMIKKCAQCGCFLPVGVFALKGKHIRRMHGLLQELGGTVRSAVAYQKVAKSATRDLLSGLLNDTGYWEYLARQFAIASHHAHPLSVCVLAVDNFPNLCAACGRDEGDMLLVEMASLLKRSVRRSDLVARYKGETFCIIFPLTCIEEAFRLSEEIRKRISTHSFCHGIHATVSAGVAGYPDDGVENVGTLHSRALAALRQAKISCDKAVAYGTVQR